MSRNFYVTGRPIVGGNDQPSGPHITPDTQRDNLIHPFEIGSYCLLFGVLIVPALFVCAAVFGYALFIAEPI